MRNRNDQGVGSIIGGVFFLLIIISGYTYYTVHISITEGYNETLETMNALDWDHNQENLVIEDVTITGSNTLNVTLENQGPVLSHLIYLGIFNKTASPQTEDYSTLDIYVDPTETVTNIGSGITIIEGNKYIIQLVTELGNIIEHDFYPASDVICDLNLIAVPATAYVGNNITVLLSVTHNDTDVDTIQSLTVSLEATPSGLVEVKEIPNSLSVKGIQRGESTFFKWVYTTIDAGTVTFNATYEEASTGIYALSKVMIIGAFIAEISISGPDIISWAADTAYTTRFAYGDGEPIRDHLLLTIYSNGSTTT